MKRLSIAALLIVSLLSVLQPAASIAGPSSHANAKIAPNLGLLLTLRDADTPVAPGSTLGQELARVRSSGIIEMSARFTRELSSTERDQINGLGVDFKTVAGRLANLGRIYGLRVPVDALDDLAADERVEWLEATWRPVAPAPLDVSIPASNVPAAWQIQVMSGPFGVPLMGEGVIIANFDTGVDVEHPAFLDATHNMGPSDCLWDSNGDGTFTPGVDKMFLSTAMLRYWDALGDPNNAIGTYLDNVRFQVGLRLRC